MLFDLLSIRVDTNDNYTRRPKIPLDNLSQHYLSQFKQRMDCKLKSVVLNHSLLLCDDSNCNDPAHMSAIDRLYADISESLIQSSQEFIKDRMAHREVKWLAGRSTVALLMQKHGKLFYTGYHVASHI